VKSTSKGATFTLRIPQEEAPPASPRRTKE